MQKTILFDLDGTLLPLEFDIFFKDYLQLIAAYCAPEIPREKFIRELLNSTSKMVNNEGLYTNEEVFMQSFLPALDLEREKIYPVFEDFYRTEFRKLKECTAPSPLAGQILSKVIEDGWQIVLATNPLFPIIAIEERMRWAEIEKYPWSHVTSYETSHFCKPDCRYFEEICNKLSLEPHKCWMIGNDATEDMIAGRLGFKTFLVTDHLITKGAEVYRADQQGTLCDLLDFVQRGMPADD